MSEETVVVTGGRGYLGSLVTKALTARGRTVCTVDSGLTSTIFPTADRLSHIAADIRDINDWKSVLRDAGAVVHLAAIVGDPACSVDHELAWETNYLATVRLTEACRAAGVGRIVFASTCSAYGAAETCPAGTAAPMFPQSVYAETKFHAEHHLLSSWNPDCVPYILRLATLYGLSLRMRFDLAINVMTARAALERQITVDGGTQWRPFLHVADAADAVTRSLEDRTADRPKIYNCGSNQENYRLIDAGKIIAEEEGNASVVVAETCRDQRNYRVDFTPIREELGFRPNWTIASGVREIIAAIRAGRFWDYTGSQYSDYELVRAAVDTNGTSRSPSRWPELAPAGS